ncbi:Asp23/Gls24 family envelope stress response protein [Collinsella sp. AGMB00827]|uniref:Asp23/Gls24 family envelope stress response protein n=2 Tax=Collinsella ureilytica TaxID=2869515 RepID=A0ABS7MMC2_9ACTN|nr:Asp23/Gls24 family envelope stress response protein [Collinsella urealyticum]MBY4798203.1 Asp23/Gls24 family envelope stress response protein [Collinsella urealyticum]
MVEEKMDVHTEEPNSELGRAALDHGADAESSHEMPETAEVVQDRETDDTLTYSNGVIEKIVAMATLEAEHVLGMKGNLMHFVQEQFGAESLGKGVSVEVADDNGVIVNISIIIEYGSFAPDIFEDVKTRVTERLAAMTGLEVTGINLRIEDVLTPEEFAAHRKRDE